MGWQFPPTCLNDLPVGTWLANLPQICIQKGLGVFPIPEGKSEKDMT